MCVEWMKKYIQKITVTMVTCHYGAFTSHLTPLASMKIK